MTRRHQSKSNGGQSASRKYESFAKDNKAWHNKVEKSIKKIDQSTRQGSRRASA